MVFIVYEGNEFQGEIDKVWKLNVILMSLNFNATYYLCDYKNRQQFKKRDLANGISSYIIICLVT
jgi:hypothetical protein